MIFILLVLSCLHGRLLLLWMLLSMVSEQISSVSLHCLCGCDNYWLLKIPLHALAFARVITQFVNGKNAALLMLLFTLSCFHGLLLLCKLGERMLHVLLVIPTACCCVCMSEHSFCELEERYFQNKFLLLLFSLTTGVFCQLVKSYTLCCCVWMGD